MKEEMQEEKKKYSRAIHFSAIAVCTVIALLLFLTANTAALVIEKDIGTLISEADTIVIGNVTDLQSQWEGDKIFTYVTIAARDYIKGAKGGEVTIKVPGGTVGDIACYVSDTPTFEEGEEVLVFLREEVGYFDVVGWYQGKYRIEDNEVLGTGFSVDEFTALLQGEIVSKQGIEKGRTEPAIMKVAHEVFNLSEAEGIITSEEAATPENESKPITNVSENNVTVSSPGWVTIHFQGFPSGWPSGTGWSRSGRAPCAYTWDEQSYSYYAGRYSAWCADYSLGGCTDLEPPSHYANNMRARMWYGPFSLSDATDARMTFYFRGRTESNWDRFSFSASKDGVNWYGYSLSGNRLHGPYRGADGRRWYRITFDLKNVPGIGNLCGQPRVWIMFNFTSDSSITYEGIFVDNVLIEKYVGVPVITSITPSYGPAKAAELGSNVAASDSTRVTINGLNFGTSPGYVKFWRAGTTYHDAAIESWSNTRIVCRVPGRVSSYNKPDGSGNVHVVTSVGAISNTARFHVSYSYKGGKWAENSAIPPNTRVTYKVNPNTADCPDELGAVQRAASAWNNAGANFSFVYAGTTTKTSVGADGENSIIWVNYDTGSIATATIYWRTTDPKTIVECDMEFNDLVYTWNSDITCPIGKMDVQNVATHEFGHWLGLDNLYGTTDSEKTMYAISNTCETKKRTLEPDDIAGIRYIYGVVGCGNMGVSPTSWSPTINPGASDSKIITVSASGGPVNGVTVSKVSGPAWLSVSPTTLGDIASGSSKTFTMTASPPSGISGSFPYVVRISNTCGTPPSIDVNGRITVPTIGPTTMVSVTPRTQTVSQGRAFTVNITVDPTVPIAGVQFGLSFNASLISANSVTEGNLLKQGGASTYFSPGTIDNTAGTITGVAGAITTPGQTVSSPGVFATIQMTAKSVKGTSILDLSNVIVGDVNGNPVPITVNDGSVTVIITCIGDVNGDGIVNVLDMIRVGQRWEQTGTPGWIPEDVREDGVINVLDMIMIGQHWGPCPS